MIEQTLVAFISQFVLTFLVGVQHYNLTHGYKLSAFFVSIMISIATYYAIYVVAVNNSNFIVLMAFVIGGACGIYTSISIRDKIIKFINRFYGK